jgi:GNAT superfamily N-acetyltransferase
VAGIVGVDRLIERVGEQAGDAVAFYVRLIGVRSALQGRDVGSALMRPTLQRADSGGLPAYIEASSERSAALYARLGFLHTHVLQLPEGGPPLWLTRRPPALTPRAVP